MPGHNLRLFLPPLRLGFNEMKFLRNNRGAAALEFALLAVPIIVFIIGIMQTAYIVWIDNLLHISVDTAARCGGVQSTLSPCNGANMVTTANTVFMFSSTCPVVGGVHTCFTNNGTCTADNGSGLIGTYTVSIAFVVNLTITAKSCYPNLA
jgi:Flp pilus assembly protein TadG